MINIKIENLSEKYLDDVMEIEECSYGPHHWSRDSFVNEIKNDVSSYLCAIDEYGKCVGYMGMWKILEEAHVTTLAVHPDFRRQNVAQALLVASLGKCYEQMIKYITLEVRTSNVAAIKLYEKFGFASLGMRKKYYQDNGEDALIMWTKNIFGETYKTLYNRNKEELLKSGLKFENAK